MRFDIITTFPNIFDSYFNESILERAREKKLVDIRIHNLRDFSADEKHKKVDDRPYGGGAGMVLMAEPIFRAVDATKGFVEMTSPQVSLQKKRVARMMVKVAILSAKGKPFNQKLAQDWSKKYDRIILISGRYEGIDERVKKALRAEEISIGPYVLTDGDVAAMVIISAVSRLIQGVIKEGSLEEESFHLFPSSKLQAPSSRIEYPHYTRPETLFYRGKKYRVPSVLLSGDHKKVAEWRARHSGSKR